MLDAGIMKFTSFASSTGTRHALLIFLAAFSIYSAVYGHHFLMTWDDSGYITGNETAHGLSLAHIREAFETVVIGNYAPLHLISYMVDYSLWGLDARGYLFFNILIHAVNGLLLYRILKEHFFVPVTALVASLIFIVHPVQVESVAWISERKNVLCTLFFLLAFGSTLKADQARRHYILSIVYYCAALLTKSVAVIFPFMLILHGLSAQDRLPLNLKRMVPYFVAAIMAAVVTIIVQGPEYGGGRTPDYRRQSSSDRHDHATGTILLRAHAFSAPGIKRRLPCADTDVF